MKVNCLTRKRIWEVDCLSLDAAIAASFDWRDLINMLQGHGHAFDLSKSDTILELQAQCLIHEYSHSENPISLRLENLLNDWHEQTIQLFAEWDPAKVAEHVLTTPLSEVKSYAASFWALGSDSREGFDCIRRRFHQKFQVFSVRRSKV